jgi:hypothetical protein
MKKIIVLFVLIGFAFVATAQNSSGNPLEIRSDKVINYTNPDSLEKTGDSLIYQYYYVKDFPSSIFIQAFGDSLTSSASGYTKVNILPYGSLDNSNWYVLGDTIELAALGADSDTLGYRKNYYWQYYRVKAWAIDSVQSTRLNMQILFDLK